MYSNYVFCNCKEENIDNLFIQCGIINFIWHIMFKSWNIVRVKPADTMSLMKDWPSLNLWFSDATL